MLTFRKKRQLKLNERRILVDSLQVGLASPDQIRQWAERKLLNGKKVGEVLSPETVNYNTYKPIKDGLFCERIFGPIKDNVCSCGKKQSDVNLEMCPECEVDFIESRVRRYRLGFIQLFSPVTHVWYLKGRPSYISNLLGKKKQSVEAIAYCTTFIPEYVETKNLNSGLDFSTYPKNYSQCQTLPISITFACEPKERAFFLDFITAFPQIQDIPIPIYSKFQRSPIVKTFYDLLATQPLTREEAIRQLLCYTGGEALRHLLSRFNMSRLADNIHHEMLQLEPEINELVNLKQYRSSQIKRLEKLLKRRAKQIRRLKLAQLFVRSKKSPEWMILSTLPVLPPELRPIIRLDGGVGVVSDLNKLYRRVLFANKGLQKVPHLDMVTIGFAKRSLQEAVDALLDNGKGGAKPSVDENSGRPLKSLSEILKGKKGRFRQNLLGKRVDYSGRSVIVVGPKLKLHECGLPKEMAMELFQPFLVRQLMVRHIVPNVVVAKHYIQQNHPVIWEILQHLMRQHPVLLNRAPTLHRLGIQAFQPTIVQGRAILLHPLVCTAFNADFDGDQMAVHVPLSFQARAEAWKLMWSRNNLLSPATGQPILLPSQDMVLGCYYLTTVIKNPQFGEGSFFNNIEDALQAYHQNKIELHAPIWTKFEGLIESQHEFEIPLEIRVNFYGKFTTLYSTHQIQWEEQKNKINTYIRTTTGRILVNNSL